MRKLASIVVVEDLIPIPGAELIEVATVKGWQLVVKKGEFCVGELAVYCEVDSFLPLEPQYEFLRKSSYKKLADGTEGFRLKTIRLRGQLSQGLLLPLSVLGVVDNTYDNQYKEGDDVTKQLGIAKYEPPISAALFGMAKGNFPSWIPKTEEERVQNCWKHLPREATYVATEKLHGTSATFYLKNGEFGVCSRNLDLKEEGGSTHWRVARELDVEAKLRAYCTEDCLPGIAVQGEIIGEGINGNYYGVRGHHFYAFNLFSVEGGVYYYEEAARRIIAKDLQLQVVPKLWEGPLPETLPLLLAMAEAPSVFARQPVREGMVLRTHHEGKRISTKVISNQYLLKEA